MAQRSNLGVDRILSRYTRLLANQPSSWIADSCLATSTVNSRSGKYYNLDGGFGYSSPGYGLLRTSGADFRRITPDPTQVTAYEIKEYGLEGTVDDVDAEFAGADALDLREAATHQTWARAMVEREKNFAALLFSTTTFSGYTAALSSAEWNVAAGDPMANMDTAEASIRQNTGVPLSECSMILGAEPWRALRRSSKLTDFYQYTVAGSTALSEEQVAAALGLKKIIVGRSVENTANPGATESKADIWGNFALVAHIEDNPKPFVSHGIGANFSLAGHQAGKVERYREEPRTEVVLVSWAESPIVTTASAGYLFSAVTS